MPPKTSKKRKNPEIVESESSISQQRSKRPIRHVTIVTNESENFLAPQRRQSECLANLAREDSGLARATNDLNIGDISRSSTGSRSSLGSRSSYDMKDLPPSSVKFATEDMQALNTNFIASPDKNEVIPDVKVTEFPEQYFLLDVDRKILANADFNVRQLESISNPEVQTFLTKLNSVVLNGIQIIGTVETFTDTCVDDLLRIAKLNNFPLMIRNQPPRKLRIKDVPCVSSQPDFVIEMQNGAKNNIVVIEDKHMKNVGQSNGYGETQIAIEILACGSENVRSIDEYKDQTLWAVRVISTYVTFYKAFISAKYWEELEKGLPKNQSVVVKRWPAKNGWKSGFNFAEPDGRREVLTALVKIRQKLLQ
ncbi:hypothetical protein Glove_12g67 [Diversispora epigaea]|uniref:Uncharacterized protein n=1 Tax=Diversispora epigaea TaxID=1348612 RepID=A0A397JWR7_9GLOM|nr:hypothetical protein Glove_12g67 [Diversispora epigaea]